MTTAKKPKEQTAAIVTIFRAKDMTPAGRKRIGKWLRSRADYLEKHGDLLADRFVSRFLYE